jgi:ligand-binding sensor domain-containing protein
MKKILLMVSVLSMGISAQNFWQATSGPNNNPIYSLIVTKNGTLLAGGVGGLFRSTNNGNIWTAVTGSIASKNILSIGQHPIGTLFALGGDTQTYIVTVFMSTDDGLQWADIPTGFELFATQCISISHSGTILVGGADTLYRLTDVGSSWTILPQETIFYGSINTIIFDSNDIVFAGGVYGACYSTNSGESWAVLGALRLEYFISSLAITKTNEIVAGTYYHGVHKLNGFSSFWTPIGLTGKSSLSMITNEKGDVFLGRSNGDVLKYMGDTNWVSIGTGIPSTYVWCLALDSLDYMYAGTENGLVYRSNNTVTEVFNNFPNELKYFSLQQNYPNPFNPVTTIVYKIPQTQFVTLKVYDILGREVATLVNEEKPAGSYEMQFTANGLTSGIYFYHLKTVNYSETKKMIFLK